MKFFLLRKSAEMMAIHSTVILWDGSSFFSVFRKLILNTYISIELSAFPSFYHIFVLSIPVCKYFYRHLPETSKSTH